MGEERGECKTHAYCRSSRDCRGQGQYSRCHGGRTRRMQNPRLLPLKQRLQGAGTIQQMPRRKNAENAKPTPIAAQAEIAGGRDNTADATKEDIVALITMMTENKML